MKNTKARIICTVTWLFLILIASFAGCSPRNNLSKGILVLPDLDTEIAINQDGNVMLRGTYEVDKDDNTTDIPYTLTISKGKQFTFETMPVTDRVVYLWDGEKFFSRSKDLKTFTYYSPIRKQFLWGKRWEAYTSELWSLWHPFAFMDDSKEGFTFYQSLGRDGSILTHFTKEGQINFSGDFKLWDTANHQYRFTSFVANHTYDCSVIADLDGNCYIIGNVFKFWETEKAFYNYPFVCKVSPTGEALWCYMLFESSLPEKAFSSYVLSAYLDGDRLLLTGNHDVTEQGYSKIGWFAMVDTDGKFLWKKDYALDSHFFPNSITEDESGSYWISGQTYKRNTGLGLGGGDNPAIIQLSADGDIQVAKKYGTVIQLTKEQEIDDTYYPESFGQFYQMAIDKDQNKYVVANLLDLPVLCFLDSNNENAILPSHPIETVLQNSWQLAYPNWVPVRFVWEPVSLDMTQYNDNTVLPDFTLQSFSPIWITKDEKNDLIIQSDQQPIPVKSIQKILGKATLFSANIEDVQQAIKAYNKNNAKEEN
ncbi:hypothetical protein LLG10_08470 [bacterium]|nr:hypothetical protein [bacterium]